MCYPCSHCNKCGRMPQPGMCGRCGYVNEPGVAACVQCGFAFPAPPGRSSGAKAPKMPTADAHGGGLPNHASMQCIKSTTLRAHKPAVVHQSF